MAPGVENGFVAGGVRDGEGLPLEGVSVTAFSVLLHDEELLGRGITDADGQYRISIESDDGNGAARPNVRIAVLDDAGRELVSSAVRYAGEAKGAIDLTLRADSNGASEFERLIGDLGHLLRGTPLADSSDVDSTFLARSTGIPSADVEGLVRAVQRADGAEMDAVDERLLPAEIWYSWHRQGLDPDLATLWQRPTDELVGAVRSSIDAGVVPAAVGDDLAGLGARIDNLKLDFALDVPALGTPTSLGALLATLPTPLALDQQRAVAGVVSRLQSDDPQLATRISEIEGFNGDAAGVARTLRVGVLTDGNVPMMNALQSRLAHAGEDEATLRPLAALRPEEWVELAYTHGVPAGAAKTPVDYADALAATVERQHPTAALASHLTEGRRLASVPLLEGVRSFLDDHPAFDITTSNVNALNEPGELGAVDVPEPLLIGLRTLQRLHALDATWDETARLLEHDISSPHHLLEAGPERLRVVLDGQVDADRVDALHRGAQDLHNLTFATFTATSSPFSAPNVLFDPVSRRVGPDPINPDDFGGTDPTVDPRPFPDDDGSPGAVVLKNPLSQPHSVDRDKLLTVIPRGGNAVELAPPTRELVPPALWEAAERQPGLESLLQRLFGLQDVCACGHCNSVLGQAAYFVDVLKFVDDAQLGDRLLRRRPDLLDLELTCENANTELPAIDLALEVLENAVALPLDIDLPPGTDVLAQLAGPTVGAEVQNALQSTVRMLSGPVRAEQSRTYKSDGTTDWTVIDGHRRWTLTARAEDALRSRTATGQTGVLDLAGQDIGAAVSALNRGRVPAGAQERLVTLFSTSSLDRKSYRLTVTPEETGRRWRVDRELVAQLILSSTGRRLALATSRGLVWWATDNVETIAAVKEELTKGSLPRMIDRLLRDRFDDIPATIAPADRASGEKWVITSAKRTLTLTFRPASLIVTSLAYQSGATGADPIAGPENRNPAAYRRLAGAEFPCSLPFDLSLEEVRLFLERCRSSRRRLLELMIPVDKRRQDDATLSLEVLRLSAAEARLIAPDTPPSDDGIYACWGLSTESKRMWDAAAGRYFAPGSPLGLLKNVSILLQQSQLEFEELQATLATRFVSQGQAPLVIGPRGACVPSEMTIAKLTIGHVDRVNRFARLRRRLGWSAEDLDSAISPNAALDPTMLQRLAHLSQLRDLLDVPIPVLVAWCDITANTTGHERTLARGLRITRAELEHALALLGVATPFRSPGALLEFCEQVVGYRSAAIPFEDLGYLLQHRDAPASDVMLDAPQAMQLADAARDAAKSIVDAPEPAELPATADAATVALAHATHLALLQTTVRNREDAVVAALAACLGAARDLVGDLLRTRLHDPRDPAKVTPAIHVLVDADAVARGEGVPPSAAVATVLMRLHKAAFVCGALKIGPADLRLLRSSVSDDSGLTALDFDALPVMKVAAPANIERFEQLLALVHVRGLASRAPDLLGHYAAVDFRDLGAARHVLAVGLQLGDAEVLAAADHLGMTYAAHYRDPVAIRRLIELLAELKRLGGNVAQAATMAAASPGEAAATTARELLRSKYDESSWHDMIRPIADTLRERQRDALVGFLVGRDQLRTADELYEHYLIDVQTGSCLQSTRILQAIAALQLFVQRVLLNLEPPATVPASKREGWEWMGNYRVWEANRKVFLYPENWLLPELRDDKTAIFRQLESTLTEQEPSLESARDAVLGYLEDLGELAQITTIAMYDDHGTLYVVGRTPNQPYRYFWRSCVNFGETKMSWTGWEAIDVDNGNDFIMPFVFQGDLHVAWPTFRRTIVSQGDPNETPSTYQETPKWEVQLAWMRRTSRGWSKRKLGHQPMVVDRLINKTEFNSFVFRVLPTTTGPGNAADESAIDIACHAAFTDDPVRQTPTKGHVLAPVGEPTRTLDDITGNIHTHTKVHTKLRITPECWGEFTPEPNLTKYERPVSDVVMTVTWHTGGRNLEPLLSHEKEFPATGVVELDVANNQQVTVSFARKGSSSTSFPAVTLSRNGEEYDLWDLKYTVIFDIGKRSLLGSYDEGRPVHFVNVGYFSLDALHDLNVKQNTKLTPFASVARLSPPLNDDVFASGFAALPIGNSFAFPTIGDTLPVRSWPFNQPTIDHNPADQLTIGVAAGESTAELDNNAAWYLHDGARRWYFAVQRTRNRVLSWPDGQDFVGSYRRRGVRSVFEVFDPATQAMRRPGLPSANGLEGSEHWNAAANPLRTTASVMSLDPSTPYAAYNWELFLHTPLAIADHLARQQRFEDARRWLHVIFDPTTEQTNPGIPQFWRFLPFRNGDAPDAIATLLTSLSKPLSDPAVVNDISSQIDDWEKDPFMPHLIARLRPSAYQWHTFFAYIDLLIGWGDQLFRRDTRESVNDATQLYVLAAKLLGPRPRSVPATATKPQTYRVLRNQLDGFGNDWVVYADLPAVREQASQRASKASSNGAKTRTNGTAAVGSNGSLATDKGRPIESVPPAKMQLATTLSSLAFCIPQNEKLTAFYDRIDDRLRKVRSCRNIDGIARDLPLVEPPIDPLLLIKAKSAGLDLDAAVAGLGPSSRNGQLPNYRFTYTLQKALELTGELKALGGALLGALEKQDAEELTLLRSRHELAMHKLVRDTRQQQILEAEANIVALQKSEETVKERFAQYQKLLGKTAVTMGADGVPVVEQASSLTVSTDAIGGASGLGLTTKEVDQLRLAAIAQNLTQAANMANAVGGVLAVIPNVWAGAVTAGQTFGGSNLGSAAGLIAKSIEMVASEVGYSAGQMGTFAGYERRQDEWVHQSKLALAELKQLDKQVLAATIRKEMAELELRNHDQQFENAQQADEFMRDKFTNKELYRWMSSQIAEVYFRTYQLAIDQARKAERAYRRELGLSNDTTSFVQTGYWDNLKKGLIAGDQLYHDLRRMESAYLDQNKREYEITKHISLAAIDPVALLTLKEAGECTVRLPETLFDLDYPGHYMRRMKTVSVSIPCVRGPYATVNCTLELQRSEVRQSNALHNGAYRRGPTDSTRFEDQLGVVQAIVTSSGQNDSGLFEMNLRDERYLPFEGAGAVSTWRLTLPQSFRQFDYSTISDVVMHMKYTARDGGRDLRTAALTELEAGLAVFPPTAPARPLSLLVSLRNDFPSEWARLVAAGVGDRTETIRLDRSRFPSVLGDRVLAVKQVDVFISSTVDPSPTDPVLTAPSGPIGDLIGLAQLENLAHFRTPHDEDDELHEVVTNEPAGASWSITASSALRTALDDLVLVFSYIADDP